MHTHVTDEEAGQDSLKPNRIEALQDGVFAIVMTLLVLEIKIPELADGDVARHVLEQWPVILSYFGSFTLLGIFWVGLHAQYNYIKFVDRPMLWINLLFLMFIALLPFSAAIMGRYGTEQFAVILYGTHLTILGLINYWNWTYATTHHRLVDHSISNKLVKLTKKRILVTPVASVIALLISFAHPLISLIIFIIIPPFYIIPGGIDRFWHKPAVPHDDEPLLNGTRSTKGPSRHRKPPR